MADAMNCALPVICAKGALSDSIAPTALMYLEQTGLMNPQVPTAPEPSLIGWWY